MKRLSLGKIPIDILDSTVLSLTGARSRRVVTPPKAGVDFAAVRVNGGFMIVSADPVTGVADQIGRYAVRVSANDVATSGNRAQFGESVILLPEGSSKKDLRSIAMQIHEAARDSGIAILGGHTEVTPGLRRPIVVFTAIGLAGSYVTAGGAKAGDSIFMTKTAGLEGTSELAREFSFPPGEIPDFTLSRGRAMIGDIDVTGEAVTAFHTGIVHAMHDCTEGGVLGAVYEMSLASGLGFEINDADVPVSSVTKAICENLSIDPMRLIGSGSLLIAVPEVSEKRLRDALHHVCRSTKIGKFREGGREVRTKDGLSRSVNEAPEDELWRVLSRPGRRRKGF